MSRAYFTKHKQPPAVYGQRNGVTVRVRQPWLNFEEARRIPHQVIPTVSAPLKGTMALMALGAVIRKGQR